MTENLVPGILVVLIRLADQHYESAVFTEAHSAHVFAGGSDRPHGTNHITFSETTRCAAQRHLRHAAQDRRRRFFLPRSSAPASFIGTTASGSWRSAFMISKSRRSSQQY